MGSEVTSVLAVYYAATSDADARHHNYALDSGQRHGVTTSQRCAAYSVGKEYILVLQYNADRI